MLKKLLLSTAVALIGSQLAAQEVTRILFIGNSYTYVNDLPAILLSMSLSTGDSLYYESNLPGGASFESHVNNPTTLSKIKQGNWDFVVLQDQSQRPAFPENDVNQMVYPFAKELDSLINAHNSCAETIFYMTWGRKNGDASNCNYYPPLCTYEGMDSLINLRYQTMATDNLALVSPVGQVWNYLRKNHPSLELYDADESHPSRIGSYAAACAFYAMIYRKNPEDITYHFNLDPTTTAIIKSAAKTVVYDQYTSWRKFFPTKASFKVDTVDGNTIKFINTSLAAKTHVWDFGDGSALETSFSPSHTFLNPGTYSVKLIAGDCPYFDTTNVFVNIVTTGFHGEDKGQLKIYPNPANHSIQVQLLETEEVNSYCIYSITGKKLFEGTISGLEATIDISQLPNGSYYLELNQSVRGRFVKN